MIGKQGDLNYLHVSNKVSEAKIALQGAHIFHFQTKGKKPLLWLSESAYFEHGRAIRGGIPICWPWFGPHPTDSCLPNHGFVRTALWEHIKTEEISQNETVVTLVLRSSPQSLKLWPHLFELTLEISISSELKLTLITKNIDLKAFNITQALHTYLSIDDINETYIDGLDNKAYYNKVNDSYNNIQVGRLYFVGETDRIYQAIDSAVSIHEDDKLLQVKTEGSQTVVIWNPAEELAAKMPDLSDHKTMLCIESANALDEALIIQPNDTHKLTTIIFQD